MHILQLYHRHLASLTMIILPCKILSVVQSFVLKMETVSMYQHWRIKPMILKEETSAWSRYVAVTPINNSDNLVHCSRNREDGGPQMAAFEARLEIYIYFLHSYKILSKPPPTLHYFQKQKTLAIEYGTECFLLVFKAEQLSFQLCLY